MLGATSGTLTMTKDVPIKISESAQLSGSAPIVLLGPNGAGKTRLALTMAGWNHANLIAALRDIALPPDVVMRSMEQASQELTNHLNRRSSRPWELSSEINDLFSKLMAEDAAAAIRFRDQFSAGSVGTPERTKLMRLQEVWTHLFPGRHIDFTGYHPWVRSDYGSASGKYPAQQMSDGERVALYLAGRVLDSDQKIIIVDEPEVHFHSRLGTRFWNEMEQLRQECRFVYITHDLPFALSRREATFVIVMPSAAPQVVSLKAGLPKDLTESLLAAATFSIHAKRIVFCEGVEGPSLDQALYSAWFFGPDTAVIPVETCENVVRCTAAFGESRLVSGVDATGIVDRDYWPDAYLAAMPTSVVFLHVHEVENLLCLERVFVAVAEHLGVSASEATSRYQEFLNNAKSKFTGGLFNKQLSERFRRRCEHEYRRALNGLAVAEDEAQMEVGHVDALDPTTWKSPPLNIFAEEKARLERALKEGADQFNGIYPGKVFVKLAASAVGMGFDSYLDLVCSALKAKEHEPLFVLGRRLEEALTTYLPSRACKGDV